MPARPERTARATEKATRAAAEEGPPPAAEHPDQPKSHEPRSRPPPAPPAARGHGQPAESHEPQEPPAPTAEHPPPPDHPEHPPPAASRTTPATPPHAPDPPSAASRRSPASRTAQKPCAERTYTGGQSHRRNAVRTGKSAHTHGWEPIRAGSHEPRREGVPGGAPRCRMNTGDRAGAARRRIGPHRSPGTSRRSCSSGIGRHPRYPISAGHGVARGHRASSIHRHARACRTLLSPILPVIRPEPSALVALRALVLSCCAVGSPSCAGSPRRLDDRRRRGGRVCK